MLATLVLAAAACSLAGAAHDVLASGDPATRAMPKAAGQVDLVLGGAYDLATIQIDGSHYALIAGSADDGILIINITNPASPSAVASVRDGAGEFEALGGVRGIAVMHMQGMVYALAASMSDDGIQIVNVTNPASPSAVAAVFDNTDGFVALNGVHDIEIIYVQDRVYALASGVAEDAVQIIDVTDPTSPSAAAAIRDGVGGFDALDGVRDAHAAAGPHMLVLASSGMDDGIQIINFTDPAAPSAVASVFDGEGGFLALEGVRDTATFRTDGRHYVLAAGAVDDAIQVADVTNPAAPSAVAAVFDGTGGFDSLDPMRNTPENIKIVVNLAANSREIIPMWPNYSIQTCDPSSGIPLQA